MSKNYNLPGFLFGGIESGIKKDKSKDLGIIFSEVPAKVAGVFTTNKIKAAPVQYAIKKIKSRTCKALIVNSGNANACTGEAGLKNVKEINRIVAKELHISEDLVLPSSTGIIGQQLPMRAFVRGIPKLVEHLSRRGLMDFASSIITTDSIPKIVFDKINLSGEKVTICGIAKGAGMVMPNMATTLVFVLTDVEIDGRLLDKVFRESINNSFNSITIDGDMSTNDTALIFANGFAENPKLKNGSSGLSSFRFSLNWVLKQLAKMIVKDGEGSTKFVRVKVTNARTVNEAKKIAFKIANSPLVKTAIFGEDPNWGRIMAAIGASGVEINPNRIDLSLSDVSIVKNGVGTGRKFEARASKKLLRNDIRIVVNLNMGNEKSKVYTCDFSPEYVRINAGYRS